MSIGRQCRSTGTSRVTSYNFFPPAVCPDMGAAWGNWENYSGCPDGLCGAPGVRKRKLPRQPPPPPVFFATPLVGSFQAAMPKNPQDHNAEPSNKDRTAAHRVRLVYDTGGVCEVFFCNLVVSWTRRGSIRQSLKTSDDCVRQSHLAAHARKCCAATNITWFQIQLILTTCQIRYHAHCWIIVAMDSSEPRSREVISSTVK